MADWDNGGLDCRCRREPRVNRQGNSEGVQRQWRMVRWGMANRPELQPASAVVVTNPDEDCSAEAFHALLDDLLAGPEPELESLGAAEALRELRVHAEA